jgi:uncharacterized membrane protein
LTSDFALWTSDFTGGGRKNMLRERLVKKGIGEEKDFHWRSREILRFEGFSDAVFAFAVTLLVISLEVPHTFAELLHLMRGFLAFAICFAMLMLIWYHQYLFFRRYGMHDTLTIVLNSVLIFVVLFYIYPLKFLFTFLMNLFFFFHEAGEVTAVIQSNQMPTLMIIYGLGFFAVFLVFFLLYLRAYRQREELGLDEVEVLHTRSNLQGHVIDMSIALLSLAIVVVGGGEYSAVAGWAYGLLGPAHAIHGTMMGNRVEKLKKQLAAAAS